MRASHPVLETVTTSVGDVDAIVAPAPVAATSLAAGERIGRYTIRRRLGEGGMGVVYAAHDPELAREVALKVLRPERSASEARELRLQREARALARLAHHNVVRVFDVGTHGQQVFLAMELVDGITVAEWLAGAPRTWREVLDVYRAAGRGLAEAHAAGIVHRDFKPSNVMIDRKGRVVVTDFGLARAMDAAGIDIAAGSDDDRLEPPLTREGSLLGTPRYMAPEQLGREAATALSDQYSFAIALFEGVSGKRPFAGTSTDELMVAMRAERIEPAARMPRWLRRTLGRALAAAPERRFPTMDALLATLAKGRRRPARIAVGVGAVAVVAASVTATALLSGHAPAVSCEKSAARVAAAWTAVDRARITAQLPALRPAFGAQAATRVIGALDVYAAQLRDQWLGTCRATVEAAPSPSSRVADPQCLDAGLRSLRKVATAFAGATTAELVDHADDLLGQLTDCEHRGPSQVAPPPSGIAPSVDRLRDGLADSDVLAARGDYTAALATVRPLVEQARLLGYAPLLGEALVRAGELGHQLQDARADADLREAAEVASGAHDDRTAMKAWVSLLSAAAYDVEHPDRFDSLFVAARAAAARTGDAQDRATLDLVQGEAQIQAGKSIDAVASCQRALDAVLELHGANTLQARPALRCIGNAREEHGEYEGARDALQRALVIDHAAVGVDHPITAEDEQTLGELQLRTGQFKEGIATIEHALAIRERVFGPTSTAVARTEHTLGNLILDSGHPEEALPHLQRGLAIATANHGADSAQAAAAYASIGSAYSDLHRRDEARPLFERAIAIYERAGKQDDLGITLINLADLLINEKKWDEALTVSQRAVTALEASVGKASPITSLALYDTARSLTKLDRAGEAIPLLERAIAQVGPNEDPFSLATFQVALAEALWVTHGDGARAASLAREAIATLTKIGESAGAPQVKAEAERLLRQYGKR